MTKQSITAIALSLCLSGAMLTSCSESAEKTIATTKKIIKVFPIQKKTVTDTGEWIGYLRGVQDTDLYPRVSGFITEYKEGQYVEEGEVIYQIDSKVLKLRIYPAQDRLHKILEKTLIENGYVIKEVLPIGNPPYCKVFYTEGKSNESDIEVFINILSNFSKLY